MLEVLFQMEWFLTFLFGMFVGAVASCIIGVMQGLTFQQVLKFLFLPVILPFRIMSHHRAVRSAPKLWFGFWFSDFGCWIRKLAAIILFYLGFVPKTAGYSNGAGNPPDISAAGWWYYSDPDIGEMSYWLPLNLKYLREKDGQLKKEYW